MTSLYAWWMRWRGWTSIRWKVDPDAKRVEELKRRYAPRGK